MSTWSIEFVDEKAEKDFLSLDPHLKARFIHIAELIETFSFFSVGLSHIRLLQDKLWEIGIKALILSYAPYI